MKVLGIAASARRHGNSEILLDKALEGAASKGAKVEKVLLKKLEIRPCRACGGCRKSGSCVIKDDMRYLYRKLQNSDAIIISSPVYFGSIPAQLKATIDRCQSLWVKYFILKQRRPIRKRKGVFISVSGHNRRRFFQNSREIIEIFFMVIGLEFISQLYVPHMEHVGDVLKKRSALKKAFECGLF